MIKQVFILLCALFLFCVNQSHAASYIYETLTKVYDHEGNYEFTHRSVEFDMSGGEPVYKIVYIYCAIKPDPEDEDGEIKRFYYGMNKYIKIYSPESIFWLLIGVWREEGFYAWFIENTQIL